MTAKRIPHKGRYVKKTGTPVRKAPKIRMAQLPLGVRPEMKKKNIILENINTLVLGNALGPVQQPLEIATSDGGSGRIGNKITLRGLHVKGHFFNKTGNPAFFVRMLILEDKSENTSTFTGADLLVKGSAFVQHNQGTESAYLSLNKNRYKIHSDKLLKLSSSNVNAENVKMFNTFIKFNKTIKYDGSGTSQVTGGNIQVAYWCINPSGAVIVAQQVEANYSTTAYYQDA